MFVIEVENLRERTYITLSFAKGDFRMYAARVTLGSMFEADKY